jgi:glutaredoxin 2
MIDRHGKPIELTLFKYDACPFCQRVMGVIDELGITVEMRDTRRDPEARRQAVQLGGRTQVPMLLVNGEPMYESSDIVHYLRTEVGRAG